MKFNAYIRPLLSGYYKHYRQPKPRLALVVGMLPWQNLVGDWVLESSHIQIQRHFNQRYFDLWLKPFINRVNPVIYIWGYKAPDYFIDYIRKQELDIFFLEVGFFVLGRVIKSVRSQYLSGWFVKYPTSISYAHTICPI